MKKHKAILAAVALLAVPAISSAILIGDFEGGSMDGWGVPEPSRMSGRHRDQGRWH